MHKQKIINTFKKYLQTSDIILSFSERFLGGMSNYTYHVIVNNVNYVIRIANKDGKEFVNYATEKLHLFLVEPSKLTSKTLYYDTHSGVKISSYIPGFNLTSTLEKKDYSGVALLLKALHELPLEGVSFGQESRLSRYEKCLQSSPEELYLSLKASWLNEYNDHYADINKVFTHGDAQRSNIIKNGSDYSLLDFEFAGMNDPYFDIASFGNIDFEDSLRLLDYYLMRPALPAEKRRVMFHRMYQVLQWHIVALVKHEMGQSEKLHIDFAAYSAKYLVFASVLWDKIKTLPVS